MKYKYRVFYKQNKQKNNISVGRNTIIFVLADNYQKSDVFWGYQHTAAAARLQTDSNDQINHILWDYCLCANIHISNFSLQASGKPDGAKTSLHLKHRAEE